MKTAILFLLLLVGKAITSQGEELPVRFEKNVEVLGLAYLIGFHGPELEANPAKKGQYPIAWRHYTEFRKYAGSPNLQKSLGVADHLWLDYLIALLVQVDEFPNARLPETISESAYLRFSQKKDKTEAKVLAQQFLEGLNAFYREADFDNYWKREAPLYAETAKEVKARFPQEPIVTAIEQFYRSKKDSYTLVPSLTLPAGMGFGIWQQKEGKSHILNVFGPVSNQERGSNGFADVQRLRDLTIHEFSHPFANPEIDKQQSEAIQATEKRYEPIRESMTNQGYPTWKICLYEHFVRAGEVVIARNAGREEDARRLLDYNTNERKFIYLPEIVDQLTRYSRTPSLSYTEAVRRVLDGWR